MTDTKVTIKKLDGGLIWSGYVDDSSYRSKEVMGDNKLFLHLSSDTPIQMPLFASATFKGEKYFLWKPENFKKLNTENHEYKLEMDTYLIYLKSQKYEFFTTTTSKDIEISFSLSASPRRFAQLAVSNMNLKDEEGGWKVGECIEADEVNLDFDDMTIWDALNMVAERFNTEWEVENKTIHIWKVQKMEEHPVPLTYGYDGGILPGISRSNGTGRVGVLRVKTSDTNIDSQSYGFNSLRMPRDFILDWEDTQYITDKNGSKLRKYNPEHKYPVVPEATLDLTEIYPHREGNVSWTEVEQIEVEGANGKELVDYYIIEDGSIPDDLDYNDYIIGSTSGTKMTVVFQSGQLAGLEFEVMKYDHKERKFTLTSNTDNGVTYPNNTMKPGIGNKYVVLNVMLPKSYIEDAENKLLDKAAEYLYENEGDRYIYNFELDPLYAKRNWGSLSGSLNIGYFIRFSDLQYLAEPVDIRITGITEYVNRPYSPRLTLSNNVRGQSVGADIRQVQNLKQTIRRTGKGISRLTEVRWRDLEELYELLHNMLHLGFTEGIRPVVINSLMAYFGSEQLQYRWVDSKEDPITEVDMYYEVDNEKATFMVEGGIMQHMTLGIDAMQPDYGANEYKFWDIAPLPATYVGDRGFLWLYIRCEKEGTKGSFLLSETEIELEAVSGYYHFLCGSLNSPFEGTRNFFTWYGFSVITPGQLRIPKIASADGKQWIDFLNKAFHLGDGTNFLSYNEEKDGQLRLKGILVQSPSGHEEPIAVFRGAWMASETYYRADEVTYNGSTWRYTSDTPGTGVRPPANPWAMVAAKGANGSDGIDGKKGDKGDTGEKGDSGIPGLPGALPTTRPWVKNETYYRNDKTCDYIIYREDVEEGQPVPPATWWRLKKTYSQYISKLPPPDDETFEQISSFESIATTTLLAEDANVGEFQFKDGYLVSQQPLHSESKDRNILLDGNTGYAHFAKGNVKFYNDGNVDIGNGNVSIRPDGNVDIIGTFSTNSAGNRIIMSGETGGAKLIAVSDNNEVFRVGFNYSQAVLTVSDVSNGRHLSKRISLEGDAIKIYDQSIDPLLHIARFSPNRIFINLNEFPRSESQAWGRGEFYIDEKGYVRCKV